MESSHLKVDCPSRAVIVDTNLVPERSVSAAVSRVVTPVACVCSIPDDGLARSIIIGTGLRSCAALCVIVGDILAPVRLATVWFLIVEWTNSHQEDEPWQRYTLTILGVKLFA
jgi:hypothetical protein